MISTMGVCVADGWLMGVLANVLAYRVNRSQHRGLAKSRIDAFPDTRRAFWNLQGRRSAKFAPKSSEKVVCQLDLNCSGDSACTDGFRGVFSGGHGFLLDLDVLVAELSTCECLLSMRSCIQHPNMHCEVGTLIN